MVNLVLIEGLSLDFFNPRSVVAFIGILQGALFALLLFWRSAKKKNQADFWLGLLLVLLCLSLVTPFIGFANVYDRNQWLTYFPFGIAYSYGACVWFYVLSLTNSKRKFGRRDCLLFVPSIVYIAFRLVLFAQSLDFKTWFDQNYYVPFFNPFISVTEFIWNVALAYFSIKHYRKYRAWLEENFSDTEKIKFDWLRNFLYVFIFVFVLSGIFDFISNFLFKLSYIQYFYFEFVLALVTYYLAISGYLRSQTIELSFAPSATQAAAAIEPEEEERKTPLTDEDLEKLKKRLQNVMQNEKPFLNPQLTLTVLAKTLGVNSTVISYAINQGFGKNFNDFVNELRILEVKQKLRNRADAENSTLLATAFNCGFNSKATFNRAFKKFTGVSPLEFQKSLAAPDHKL